MNHLNLGLVVKFDGDEANLYIPQTLESQAEYKALFHLQANILAGSSRPLYGLVQDSICGCFLMTNGWKPIEEGRWMDMASGLDLSTEALLKRVEEVRVVLGDKMYTGRGLASLGLPNYLCMSLHNKAMPEEPSLVISRGVIMEGALNKAALGARAGSIHHLVAKFHSNEEGMKVLSLMGRLGSIYIETFGFSVGITDCIQANGSLRPPPQVDEAIEKAFVKARMAESSYDNPFIREIKVTSALNAAKDIGLRLAKEALAKDNRFSIMQMSGAKGSDVNIAQIVGLLGQQIVCGTRVEPTLNRGKRVLPHYPLEFDLEDPEDLELYYESRGFIRDSYFKGLNPRAFWHQAAAGREGITDTACKTASAGYCERQLARMLEDLTVQYDGSVRTRTGKIIQLAYGGDGMDGSKISKVDGVYQPINVYYIVNELNAEFEAEYENKGGDSGCDFFESLGIEEDIGDEPLSPNGSDASGGSVASIASPQSVGSRDDDYDD